MIEDAGAAEHAAGILHRDKLSRVYSRVSSERSSGQSRRALRGGGVEHELFTCKVGSAMLPASAQQCSDPASSSSNAKGLVRYSSAPAIKPFDLVLEGVLGRQHQDHAWVAAPVAAWRRSPCRPCLAACTPRMTTAYSLLRQASRLSLRHDPRPRPRSPPPRAALHEPGDAR